MSEETGSGAPSPGGADRTADASSPDGTESTRLSVKAAAAFPGATVLGGVIPGGDVPAERSRAPIDRGGIDDFYARADHLLIADMVERGARVLDVGCGDGSLLALLARRQGVDGRGIELSRQNVSECLAKGLAVIQGDADTDLADYPDDAFDYVILSQTIQATRRPRWVLEHMLRIGRRAIITFPNFGHWRVRIELGLKGRMPVTDNLPYSWYDTPNIHFCTIRDFVSLCREVGAGMERAVALDASGRPVRVNLPWWAWNLLGEQGVFLLRRKDG
jgi:methionine biosynthesis protein MetW